MIKNSSQHKKIRLITSTYKIFNNKTTTSIEFIVFLPKNYEP